MKNSKFYNLVQARKEAHPFWIKSKFFLIFQKKGKTTINIKVVFLIKLAAYAKTKTFLGEIFLKKILTLH